MYFPTDLSSYPVKIETSIDTGKTWTLLKEFAPGSDFGNSKSTYGFNKWSAVEIPVSYTSSKIKFRIRQWAVRFRC
jgi:hypothetical protein